MVGNLGTERVPTIKNEYRRQPNQRDAKSMGVGRDLVIAFYFKIDLSMMPVLDLRGFTARTKSSKRECNSTA